MHTNWNCTKQNGNKTTNHTQLPLAQLRTSSCAWLYMGQQLNTACKIQIHVLNWWVKQLAPCVDIKFWNNKHCELNSTSRTTRAVCWNGESNYTLSAIYKFLHIVCNIQIFYTLFAIYKFLHIVCNFYTLFAIHKFLHIVWHNLQISTHCLTLSEIYKFYTLSEIYKFCTLSAVYHITCMLTDM